MKVVLWAAGLALATFSGLHWFITYEHWRQRGPMHESVMMPALVAILSAAVAIWLFRRAMVRANPS